MLRVEHGGGGCTVVVRDGDIATPLPPLWLRERSPEPSELDAATGQRLVNVHRLPDDLSLVAAEVEEQSLRVWFSDGHRATYLTTALLASLDLPDGLPPRTRWGRDLAVPPAHEWPAVASQPVALHAALADLLRLGTIVVTGAPTAEGTVLDVAGRLGFVRETNFGRLFDVRSVPRPTDLAYTSIFLGPHTDNPYRDPVPGIQLLHCLVNDTTGGQSTLVDALAVTERLRDEDPASFELLATVPVQYRFHDAGADIRSRRTVIERDHSGAVTGLAYSPRLDCMPLLPDADTRAYQRARQRLAELLVDPEFEIRFTLRPGEVEVFDNSRVLHGRTAFDPREGLRHLQGCYIDHDGPRSHYRMLNQGCT